jgi:peroxiredoxin
VETLTPDFILKDTFERDWQLSKTLGQVVIINWFDPLCEICQLEAVSLKLLHEAEDMQGAGLIIVGIAVDYQSKEDVIAFRDNFEVPFQILYDARLTTSDGISVLVSRDAYGVNAVPFNTIIDREGKIVFSRAGGLTEGQMRTLIDPLL